jgi:uncharacterized protein (TIGR03437 family)
MSFRVSVLSLLISFAAFCQSYTISAFAGGPPHPAAQARNAAIGNPAGVAVDSGGSIYFFSRNCVFKVDSTGALTRIAGNYTAGYSGDGGPAASAQIHMPLVANAAIGDLRVYGNLAVDRAGNVYIPDPIANRVRKVSPTGVITTFAGNGSSYNGVYATAGDGGPAANAELTSPHHVAVDGNGNLYILEARIRKVTPDGLIHTVTAPSYYWGIAVDQTGSLYGARYNLVQKIAPDGTTATLLSNAQAGNATDVALDGAGNLYIADVSGNSIRKLSPDGTLSTTAGNGNWGFAGDGIPASSSPIAPEGLAIDAAGNLYVADYDAGRIRKISAAGTISTVAGNGGQWFEGDGGPATNAVLSSPGQLAVDKAGNVYIADRLNNRIRQVAPDGTITTIAGNGGDSFSGDGGQAVNASLAYPSGSTFDGAGNLYTVDLGGGFRKISPGGIITTVPGSPSSSSPPTPPAARPIVAESAIAVDSKGNLYFIGNGIRSLSPDGTLSVIGGLTYYYGGLAVDAADTLYYSLIYTADSIGKRFANGTYGNVTLDTGCGSGGELGFDPYGLAIDKSGNVFVADLNGSTVRRITPSGTMETIAGNLTNGYSGDGGPATSAQLNQPASIAADAAGNIYISDPIDNVVRVLRPSAQPPVSIAAVTNGASNLAGPIAPGEIVVIYGSGLGPEPLVACESRSHGLVSELNETQVYIDGVPAPLLFTSANQIAAVVPYEIGPGLSLRVAHVSVVFENGTSMGYPVAVTASAPGIFTADESGRGQAAAVNQNGTFNGSGFLPYGEGSPAKPGEYISLYATGEGQTSPPGVDGQLAQTPLPQPLLPVTVTIGGQLVQPQYAGAAPGDAGLMQVNVQIPAGTKSGNVPVTIQVGQSSSQSGVTIAVGGN